MIKSNAMLPELSDDLWLQIEMAANGCVSGTLREWPLLDQALKHRGHTLVLSTHALELNVICGLVVANERLRAALRRLDDAADVFLADQSRATDPRVGCVQPVSVADCEELNEASREARKVLVENDGED